MDAIYVWAWLKDQTTPLPAGRLALDSNGRYTFVYAKSYLSNPLAYPLQPQLPLEEREFIPEPGLDMHGVFRDALPDGWGQNVIDYQHGGQPQSLDVYMLESGTNRFANLDFQASARQYTPRNSTDKIEVLEANIHLLLEQKGIPSTAMLALVHGTSIGGAKPKIATDRQIIKLSTSDSGNSIRREVFATIVAQKMGVETNKIRLERFNTRRFDSRAF